MLKSITKTFVVTLCLLTVMSAPAFGSSHQYYAQSFFFDRKDAAYPIPSDSEVIKTLGIPTRFNLPPRKMKFLVWNLHKGADAPFKYEFLALGFDRDIIMGQEMFLDKNMTDVFRFLPHFLFTTATSFFSGKEKSRTGVLNASTVRPSSVKFLRTESLEPIVRSPKVALITTYPIAYTDKKLTVVNIHAINFVSTKSFKQELERIYQAIKDIPSPLVFSGDFNTWNKERLSILAEYSSKLGLNEAEFFPDHRMTFNGFPLDHFLHTDDIKITSARVDQKFEGSDHKPLQVEIEYMNPSISQEELDQTLQEL
jgi:endonuclease/exonuclease/phosphatase (EEP) superfamily protein YafD